MLNKAWWLMILAAVSVSVSASQEQDPTAPLGWMKTEQVKKGEELELKDEQMRFL